MRIGLLTLLLLGCAPGAFAETPRDLLIAASFQDASPAIALRHIDLARGAAADALRRAPADYEAALMQAMAIGYRSKLTGSRAEALDARHRFEVLVRRDPANADAQIALGAWHLGAVNRLGKFVGRAALGAQQPLGLAALDRAVDLGRSRAFFTGLAGLLRLQYDPTDTRGSQLIEAAARGTVSTPLDQVFRRSALQMLAINRAGNLKDIRATASRLLPLGQFD